MRIKVRFDRKSIENAIKKIEFVKKKVRKDLPRLYLQKCVNHIIQIANRNIANTDIGIDVKIMIQNGWNVSAMSANRIKLSNVAKFKRGKNVAVFVEFGVGIIGYGSSHKLSGEANYEYNILTDAKDQFGNWVFKANNSDEISIESNYYEVGFDDPSFVKTKGSPATMFLYNAWKEWQTTGLYKTLWEQTKTEVLGRNA